jgi:23S rRNA (pseudouridine1915-N3)-methyltransferase
VLLIWPVGKLRDSALKALCETYARRASGNGLPTRIEEIAEGKGGSVRSPQTLLRRMATAGHVTALDERGTELDSVAFSQRLQRGLGRHGDLVFLIGGAAGLPPEILTAADARFSLSAMTLPHEMARLFLLEQIYRAATILKGTPYHRA